MSLSCSGKKLQSISDVLSTYLIWLAVSRLFGTCTRESDDYFGLINFETFHEREGVIGGAGRGVCQEHLSETALKRSCLSWLYSLTSVLSCTLLYTQLHSIILGCFLFDFQQGISIIHVCFEWGHELLLVEWGGENSQKRCTLWVGNQDKMYMVWNYLLCT